MIKVIDDIEALDNFESEWIQLYEADNQVTPFQQYHYVKASLSEFSIGNDRLYIVCIKDDPTNKWIAIFPLVLTPGGILEYINAAHSDFCVPIIHPDYKHYSLFKEFSEYVIGNAEIRGLNWINVPSGFELLACLKPFFKYAIVNDINYYSTLPIYKCDSDKDFVDAFRYVQAKQRRNLRKTFSKIQDCSFEILSQSDGNPYPEDLINRMVYTMVGNGLRSKEYFSPQMLAFWKHLYNHGILSVATISENGQPQSCNLMFYDPKHNEYIKWIMLYKDNSWNMKINMLIAHQIYDDGEAVINFARGIYDYKLVNFHPDVKPLFRVMIAKNKWGHFKNIVSTSIHYFKPIVKSWLGR